MPVAGQVCALPPWPLPKAVGPGISLQVAHRAGPLVVLPSGHTAHEGWSVLQMQQFAGRGFCQCVTVPDGSWEDALGTAAMGGAGVTAFLSPYSSQLLVLPRDACKALFPLKPLLLQALI